MSSPSLPPGESVPRVRRVSGRAVVIGMLLLGVTATVVMFVYWDWHTKPFRPLTESIGRTFRHSLPKVEGGRHKNGPQTLRISLRVPFSPVTDEAACGETLVTLFRIIRETQDLTGYEDVQIHFFQVLPEEVMKKRQFHFTPAEILERASSTTDR